MTVIWRMVWVLALALLLWPELPRYPAERSLARVNAGLDEVLRGTVVGAAAVHRVESAVQLAQHAAQQLPGDLRPVLSLGMAWLLLQRGEQARLLFEQAIAQGERPELSLNLGRARALLGDEVGAQAAFLRTAWAAPNAIATLPKATREALMAQVAQLEAELRAGRLKAAPAL